MDNKEIDLMELLREVWLQRKRLIKWGIVGVVVGLVIAFSIPNQYQTTVKIAPESKTKTSGKSSLSALAEMGGVDLGSGQGADGISERIYPEIIGSTPFILDLANISVVNGEERISFYDYITQEQKAPWWSYVFALPSKLIRSVIEIFTDKEEQIVADGFSIFMPTKTQRGFVNAVKGSIQVLIDQKLGFITITTTMQDPLIAAVISDSVLSNLQRYMVDYRTAKNRNDLAINIQRLEESKAKYYFADSIYAASFDRNQSLVLQTAKIKIERLLNERILTFNIYQQLAAQVEMSKVKLQENTPIATVIEPPSVALRASSPNKPLILAAFTFLFVFGTAGVVAVKYILKK